MSEVVTLAFSRAGLSDRIESLTDAELDSLDFGVIGFDAETMVRRYNAFESKLAGLSPQRVLGNALFTTVAPCMNNFMVAQRFDDAQANGTRLDATIDGAFGGWRAATKAHFADGGSFDQVYAGGR